MEGFDLFLAPYLISQGVAIILMLTAIKNTKLARILLAMLFLGAACLNMYTGIKTPEVYLYFADMAAPWYRDFINGWFSQNSHIMVPIIAVGQFMVGSGMLLQGWWVKLACIGAIIFFISIAPLLVGSAFPFSVIVSIATLIILKKDRKEFLFKKHDSTYPIHQKKIA